MFGSWFCRPSPPPSERITWIDDPAWNALVASAAFLARLNDDERHRLRGLCGAFLDGKAINGAGGLVVDDTVVAQVAAQACLPVLKLGVAAYPRFEEIIVYPSEFVLERETIDEDGVVHRWRDYASGESWDDGPLVLAWDAADVTSHQRRPTPFAFNVVIHEFAHKLDAANGAIDGVPAFSRDLHPTLSVARWRDVLEASLDDFRERLDTVERAIPRHVDPESARADRFYAALPLDAYASQDEVEFFSVTSEAFFVKPAPLQDAYPEWYALLAEFYRQDPLRSGTTLR